MAPDSSLRLASRIFEYSQALVCVCMYNMARRMGPGLVSEVSQQTATV
jgi:hypothetical protein